MTINLPPEDRINAALSAIPTDVSLQEQLDIFATMRARHLPPEIEKHANSHLEYVAKAMSTKRTLKEGELAPDFTLSDALNQNVTLSKLLEKGPVVLVFYRGSWCPFCNLELRAFQKALPQIQELGATLVAISPMLPDHSLSMVEKQKLSFTVLSDTGNQVAHQFGLTFKLDEIARSLSEQAGAGLPKYNGDDSWELPTPGTFLIDQSRKIRLAFVDANFLHRLDPSFVIERLKELKS